jgi:GrpB-like predicted nucleotidyltransferase (UPF0157 family)
LPARPSAEPPRLITISDWSPDWAAQFAIKAGAIRQALGALALRIDHIGSTSIQGLAAKPIIDIQVSVADFEPIEAVVEPMTAAGFVWRSANPELSKRYFRELPGEARTQVHVRRLGSWNEQWALLFRDYMRGHSDEHSAYVALKRRLAERFPNDGAAYTDAKADHLWAVIQRADEWASKTGWRPGPSDG